MSKLGPMMHNAGKAIIVNNHTKRLDLMRDCRRHLLRVRLRRRVVEL